MQSIENQSLFESADSASEFSRRWLIRRFGLWMLLVALGVTGSCLLYKVASNAEADAPRPSAQTANLH